MAGLPDDISVDEVGCVRPAVAPEEVALEEAREGEVLPVVSPIVAPDTDQVAGEVTAPGIVGLTVPADAFKAEVV